MSLKNAACFALAGTSLLTLVFVGALDYGRLGVAQRYNSGSPLLASLVRAFAGLSAAVFLDGFYKKAA